MKVAGWIFAFLLVIAIAVGLNIASAWLWSIGWHLGTPPAGAAEIAPAPQTGDFWKLFQIDPRPNGVEIR